MAVDLEEMGKRIRLVDLSILGLVARRIKLVTRVGQIKGPSQPIYRPEVEAARLIQVGQWAIRFGLNPYYVQALFYLMICEASKAQMIQLQAGLYPQTKDQVAQLAELKANLLAFTSRCAATYDTKYGQEFFATRRQAQFEEDLVVKLAMEAPDGIALDLGCATGRHSLPLIAYFQQVVGYDISPAMIEVAQQNTRSSQAPNAEFVVHDLEEGIPQEDGSVGLVVMTMGTASDIPGVKNLLLEIRRVLKPEGKAFLSFYNSNALVYEWGFVPWTVGLAAEVNPDNEHCLEVTWEEGGTEHVFSLYAHPYTRSEVEGLLPDGLSLRTVMTHPSIASVMPSVLFEKKAVRNSLSEIDARLAREGDDGGAYLSVVLARS